MKIRRIAGLRTASEFLDHVAALGIELPFDEELPADLALAQSGSKKARIGNRFCILPMEGWDGTKDGAPTEHTIRRWRRFGESGAKLIWGGEAVAVEHAGRGNPNQLLLNEETAESIGVLRTTLLEAHAQAFGSVEDLMIGLQLTHSGRFSRPDTHEQAEPQTLYRHTVLDKRLPHDRIHLLTDEDIEKLVDRFVAASVSAADLGFDFVDLKHCHGYLGHEFLSSFDREGPYGGSFENRTRFLREIVERIRSHRPELQIGVRLSAFDVIPFAADASGIGVPDGDAARYPHAFGARSAKFCDDEPKQFLALCQELGIELINVTLGSPYYCPHLQRPAYFPPSDGYQPPRDPLHEVAEHLRITRQLKQSFPDLFIVGSGYSYLQQWLPNVAEAAVRLGWADSVGIGRMVLSYPDLPADVLAGRPLKSKRICRTFSDCTSAPRQGTLSGCFPLDEYYSQMPERQLIPRTNRNNR